MGLVNFVRASVESSQTPAGIEARRFAVELMDSRLKQIAARAINEVIFLRPKLWRFPDDEAAAGVDVIGQGCESLCVRSGDMVIKSVLASASMTESQRQALLEEKEEQYTHLQKAMSHILLPQTIVVDTHPHNLHKRTVQTIQPYVEYQPVLSYTKGEVSLDGETIDDASRQLEGFVAAAWSMYDESGLLPDIVGRDNLVAVDRKLVLIDTQPIPVAHKSVQTRIKHQLDAMAKKR